MEELLCREQQRQVWRSCHPWGTHPRVCLVLRKSKHGSSMSIWNRAQTRYSRSDTVATPQAPYRNMTTTCGHKGSAACPATPAALRCLSFWAGASENHLPHCPSLQQLGDPVPDTLRFNQSEQQGSAILPNSLILAPGTMLWWVRRHKHWLTTSSSIRVYSLRFLAPD